jgi:hypothetical protein
MQSTYYLILIFFCNYIFVQFYILYILIKIYILLIEHKNHNFGLTIQSYPQSETKADFLVYPDDDEIASNFDKTLSLSSTTFPKTTCFPSNHGQSTKVMKNYDPL